MCSGVSQETYLCWEFELIDVSSHSGFPRKLIQFLNRSETLMAIQPSRNILKEKKNVPVAFIEIYRRGRIHCTQRLCHFSVAVSDRSYL